MINISKYLPRQMNGPVLNSVMQSIEQSLTDSGEIESYLYNDITIANAQETELESLGKLIGYPRPLVPVGFNAENVMIIGTLPLSTDETNGLASVDTEVGGELTSVESTETSFMSLNLYRKFLDKMAILKRYGITINSVDQIAAIIDPDYTIGFDDDHDITVHFNKSIGYKNLWILSQLFYRIATIPQVIVSAG